MAEEKDYTYVMHVCKNCEYAFMDLDDVDSCVNPPDYKYCPECVKNGFKNTKEARDSYRRIARFEELIYNDHLGQPYPTEDEVWLLDKCNKIVEEYISFGKIINIKSIYNQAKEVLGYIKQDKLERNSND